MVYIFYNPKSGSRHGKDEAYKLEKSLQNNCVVYDITSFDKKREFFHSLDETDTLILCGGDGTLHHFINNHYSDEIKADICYYPTGSGNDFAKDINLSSNINTSIKKYLNDLPTVTVKGKTYSFLNNVGFGIDGYCCEMGDKIKQKSDKAVNYTAIALKGVLFDFKVRNATVSVDGVKKEYKRVWLAPTLKGRYFGGGMMATPNQNRLDPEKNVSILVCHNINKLRLLTIFPKIFKGTHTKHTKYVEILKGHEITVTYDRPTPLQIDGETIKDVIEYTVKAK